MRNLFFILSMIVFYIPVYADKFSFMKFESGRVYFEIEYTVDNTSKEDIRKAFDSYTKSIPSFIETNGHVVDDTFHGKFYKAEVPVKKYRIYEFGASSIFRSPFNAIMTAIFFDGKYIVRVEDIIFNGWNNTRPGYPSARKDTDIEELACNKKRTKLITGGHEFYDVQAFENYIADLFAFK